MAIWSRLSAIRSLTITGNACLYIYCVSLPTQRSVHDRFGKTRVLITTNVLARGIDILQITLVINYDVPVDRSGNPDFATYLHRIGRSGRFGRSGIALNFISDERSFNILKQIEAYFGRSVALARRLIFDRPNICLSFFFCFPSMLQTHRGVPVR